MHLLSAAERIRNRSRRFGSQYITTLTGVCFLHLLLIVFFCIVGRFPLAALNAASVLLCVLWLVRYADHEMDNPGIAFLLLDPVLHACVYNVLLGEQTGFYLYAFLVIPSLFFLSVRSYRRYTDIMPYLGIAMGLILACLLTLRLGPVDPLTDPLMTAELFHINALLCGLLLSVNSADFMVAVLSAQNNLTNHAQTDQLTGLMNRYGFLNVFDDIRGSQYCLVMSDIDGFKQVNDLYGHSIGDEVLREIGKVLASSIKRGDIVCRWGGEEFLLALCSDMTDTLAFLEQLRKRLSEIRVQTGQTAITVTMTFGVADCLEADNLDDLVKIADENLLRGKRAGKNCVITTATVLDTENIGVRQEKATLDTSFLEERMFDVFSATSDTSYIYINNMSTNVARWSRNAVDYFGLPGEYMYDAGSIWLGFVHPDDRAAYSADLNAVFSGKKHFHDITYRARNRNGDYVRVVCKGVITEADATHPAMFAGTMTNLGVVNGSGKLRR